MTQNMNEENLPVCWKCQRILDKNEVDKTGLCPRCKGDIICIISVIGLLGIIRSQIIKYGPRAIRTSFRFLRQMK